MSLKDYTDLTSKQKIIVQIGMEMELQDKF